MAGDAHIFVVAGPGVGRTIVLAQGERGVIGRERVVTGRERSEKARERVVTDPESELLLGIPGDTVSKRHLALENRADGLHVTSLGRNGAMLDGRRLPKSGVVIVLPCSLEVGASTLRVTFAPLPRAPGITFVRWLGRGVSSSIFAAHFAGRDELVAVKIVECDPEDAHSQARTRREAELQRRLAHPAIVRVHALVEHQDRLFLVRELVTGHTLADELARGALEPRRALAIGATIAGALAHAHEKGVVHRDVAPGNIFVEEPSGVVKLGDFGFARDAGKRATIAGSYVTKTGDAVGTPWYVAPEQLADASRAGPAADVYGLGAVMYHALSGKRIFDGVTLDGYAAAAERGVTPLGEIVPGLAREVERLVMQAVCWRAVERPGARELEVALSRARAKFLAE